ncbi:CLUMA_CG017790, isoform A [Clunio marinus]|uniref:CLUMA_CG017790, isoform A n=1 Tax=Clunio marinus TaxID=568069 RepID=A0A1J1IYF4_9DIPT|nr:CLUMA_CG017790, isoform A [Clunio marinus]
MSHSTQAKQEKNEGKSYIDLVLTSHQNRAGGSDSEQSNHCYVIIEHYMNKFLSCLPHKHVLLFNLW